jgi:DNA-binding MarR family transcriptional regulator
VERRPCEEDARGHIVAITQAGRDLRRGMWPVYAGAIHDAVGARLSEGDAVMLAALLRRLEG